MAVLTSKGLSGQIGKQLVFKAQGGKTIVSAYPGPCKKKPSEVQQLYRDCFKRAQKRAIVDCRNKEMIKKCTSYLKEGQKPFHFLIGVYQREEVKMMKECRKAHRTLEELLAAEPKKRKEVVKKQRAYEVGNNRINTLSKPINKTRAVWSYPIKKEVEVKADQLPAMPVITNRTFYGGWVSTVSG